MLPTIIAPLKSSTALSVGDSLLLTCKASGDPLPQIKWLKNGSTDINRANITKNHTVLSISRVEPNDSGTYECIARNPAGAAKSRSSVAVFRKYLVLSVERKENVRGKSFGRNTWKCFLKG